jgi:hypothetical protein
MTLTATAFLSVYMMVDAFMQSTTPNSAQDKFCFRTKYILAGLSGTSLFFPVGIDPKTLYVVTIAFFMWPKTFHQSLIWLKNHNYNVYMWIINHVKSTSRRR